MKTNRQKLSVPIGMFVPDTLYWRMKKAGLTNIKKQTKSYIRWTQIGAHIRHCDSQIARETASR